MRLRIKIRVLITISVIIVAMVVFLQERPLTPGISFWLNMGDKEVQEFKSDNNSYSIMARRYNWKYVNLQQREKDTIKPTANDATVNGLTPQTRSPADTAAVPKQRMSTDTINPDEKAPRKRVKNKAKQKYAQKSLKLNETKQYVTNKQTESVANKEVQPLKRECPKWKYERQDWTIVYQGSHSEYDKTSCPKPSNGKRIKRISFSDGSFKNTGCNKNTRECKEYPFYDFKEGVRINAPPCCRHHILTMFDHVTTELKRQGVPHCMISGGVIGWVRNKRMIPYDRDLDLIIQSDYWNTTEFWKMFQQLNEKYGYIVDDVEEFKVKLYLSKLNGNNIDIWAYWADNETISIAFHGFKKQSIETMMPFKAVNFEWFATFVPAKPIAYLNKQYGKEVWRPEKQCMVRNAEGDCW